MRLWMQLLQDFLQHPLLQLHQPLSPSPQHPCSRWNRPRISYLSLNCMNSLNTGFQLHLHPQQKVGLHGLDRSGNTERDLMINTSASFIVVLLRPTSCKSSRMQLIQPHAMQSVLATHDKRFEYNRDWWLRMHQLQIEDHTDATPEILSSQKLTWV